MNGLALHGGVIPYGGTFLIFSDYMRPSQRLAALMHQRVIYVFTHDSIGLGEDGPTHQPIEQLTALRAIPGFTMIRPADANETAEAWRVALKHKNGPVALALTRQKLGWIDREKYGAAAGLAKGAYVLADAPGGAPEVVLMSSGSEVALVLAAQTKLAERRHSRARGQHAESRAVRGRSRSSTSGRCCRLARSAWRSRRRTRCRGIGGSAATASLWASTISARRRRSPTSTRGSA